MVVNTGIINTLNNDFGNNVASTGRSNSSQADAAASLLSDVAARQTNLTAQTATATTANNIAQPPQITERNSESVRVSSSIGRAASAGQLTREQALEIYRNIARFL